MATGNSHVMSHGLGTSGPVVLELTVHSFIGVITGTISLKVCSNILSIPKCIFFIDSYYSYMGISS